MSLKVKEFIPPIVYNNYKEAQKKKRKNHRVFKPSWTPIKDGWLKGREMMLDPTAKLGQLFIKGDFDQFIFDDLAKYSLQSVVFYDIGSFMGYHSLCFAAKSSSNSKVYAFEPHPANMSRLCANIEHNQDLRKKIKPIQIALSNRNGEGSLSSNDDLDGGGGSESFIATNSSDALNEHKIMLSTLDTAISEKNLQSPNFLKIDVEGHEIEVLEGAKETFLKHCPVAYIEVHNIACMYELMKYFHQINYVVEMLDIDSPARCFVKASPNQNK